jgi:hypothetical protein
LRISAISARIKTNENLLNNFILIGETLISIIITINVVNSHCKINAKLGVKIPISFVKKKLKRMLKRLPESVARNRNLTPFMLK